MVPKLPLDDDDDDNIVVVAVVVFVSVKACTPVHEDIAPTRSKVQEKSRGEKTLVFCVVRFSINGDGGVVVALCRLKEHIRKQRTDRVGCLLASVLIAGAVCYLS